MEVLDLTHNNQIPFKVQFDDPKWKRHINSIKPLVGIKTNNLLQFGNCLR